MFTRILEKDLKRNKVITVTLFVFILMAATLVSSAVHIAMTLFGAIDAFFEQARAPHFVQMVSGDIDHGEIQRFARENPLVESQQTVVMLGVDGANIFLGSSGESEIGSIIGNSFVVQNQLFDFLLDTNGDVIHVNDGEIAVPIFHMQGHGLQIGDTVRVADGNFDKTFTITSFARDVQMNPSIVTSKRFVISENDWALMYSNFGELEYLISFRLIDAGYTSEFETMYQASNLPQTGISLTYSLYRILNSITDGVLAAVVVFISLLLAAIAALCLRFTLIAAIEEDFGEIGAMKAIGINSASIRGLYMTKYTVMAIVASVLGYGAASILSPLFTGNIVLYMGHAPVTIWNGILPSLGALAIFVTVIAFCRLVLRRFKKISAVEAIRGANVSDGGRGVKTLRLSRNIIGNMDIHMGAKAVFSRFRVYGILCFIFAVCVFLMITPLNLTNTLRSPDFVSYMGAGRSDIRLDVTARPGEDMLQLYHEIDEFLSNDAEVANHAILVTAAYRVRNVDGFFESIRVEVGDFSAFPISYTSGRAPANENEIALSHMNSVEFEAIVGDSLVLLVDGTEKEMIVSGIYNDITYGGRTAKGLLPYTNDNILWMVVNISVSDGVNIDDKINRLNAAFSNLQATDIENYVQQTMGGLISQLDIATAVGLTLGLLVAFLITGMFFKMLIAKDTKQIAIKLSVGVTYESVRLQYVVQALIILVIGLILGGIASATIGQGVAALLVPGISSMSFIVNAVMSYAVIPAALGLMVVIAVFLGCANIRKLDVMKIMQ